MHQNSVCYDWVTHVSCTFSHANLICMFYFNLLSAYFPLEIYFLETLVMVCCSHNKVLVATLDEISLEIKH